MTQQPASHLLLIPSYNTGAKLVSTNLSAEQEARLRDVFSESTETAEKV